MVWYHLVSASEELTARNGSAVLAVARALVREAQHKGVRATVVGSLGATVSESGEIGASIPPEGALRHLVNRASAFAVGRVVWPYRFDLTRMTDASVVVAHNRPWDARAIREAFPHARAVLHLHNRVMRWVPPWAKRRALRDFDAIICVSDFIRRDLLARVKDPGLAARTHVAHNGVEGIAVPRTTQDIDVLYVGRIVPEKGVHTLALALGNVPGPLTVTFVGGHGFLPDDHPTDYEKRVHRLVAKTHKTAVFTGPISPSEVWNYRARAKVTVVPSEWEEPCSLAVLEALASGSALIATTTGGTPELVGDGSAILVSPNAPRELAAAITDLLANDDRRADCAASGSDRGRQLSWTRTFETIERAV